MFCDHNPSLEPGNHISGLIFTCNDPCVWVVYPGGAAGDLLISILDKHYLRTGCEYYGINDQGRVMLYTTDYEMIDKALETNQPIEFTDQWFHDFSGQLGNRNITYGMLDQVIIGCHLYRPQDIEKILDAFGQARIINIYTKDSLGKSIVQNMAKVKLDCADPAEITDETNDSDYTPDIVQDDRVLNVPFGFLFNRDSYDRYYADIRKFLGLAGPLICFEYIEFYLSKQHALIQHQLKNYSMSI